MLPENLTAALAALDQSALFRADFGDLFVDYYLALKNAELDRFRQYCEDNAIDGADEAVTGWEQNEYYDFF